MNDTKRIYINKNMFQDRESILLEYKDLTILTFLFPSGVEGLKVKNNNLEFDLLPYKGHQIWNFKINGENVTQKSIFPYPLDTDIFGDNYGGFLYHCGLTNINGAGDGEYYPLHGELPFAKYDKNYIELGSDSIGEFVKICGEFIYRNSQDYFYKYCPKLTIRENSTILEMNIDIENKRLNDLKYMFMCHMNWHGIDGSEFIYCADKENVNPEIVEAWDDSERAKKLEQFSKLANEDSSLIDILDSERQFLNPEYCVNIKYNSDENGFAHAIMKRPDNKSFYVSFDTENLPYGLRWFCRTGDEDGVGFCLPTTGTNHSTKVQMKNGTFNILKGKSSTHLHYYFGMLGEKETNEMINYIKKIKE